AASRRVQPIDRALRNFLRHAFYAVVECPAIVTIEVALPLGKQIGNDRMKWSRGNPRFYVREQPAIHRPVHQRSIPAALAGASPREIFLVVVVLFQQIWMLRENRLRKFPTPVRHQYRPRGRILGQKLVQVNIKAERRGRITVLLFLKSRHPCVLLVRNSTGCLTVDGSPSSLDALE